MAPLVYESPDWIDRHFPLPPDKRLCFSSKFEPGLICLPIGTRLYRLRSPASSIRIDCFGKVVVERPLGGGVLGEWWFDDVTYREIIDMSEQTDLGIDCIARLGLAVPIRFNLDFNTLIILSTLVAGCAYFGEAAPQSVEPFGLDTLPGGFNQLWVPKLLREQVLFQNYGGVRI